VSDLGEGGDLRIMIDQSTGAYTRLSAEFAAVAERLSRSTVQVRGRGFGSGVIWGADGLIITNAHVARGSRAAVGLSDGRILEAVVAARSPQRDLAALKVEIDGLPAAPAGDSDCLRVGQLVIAVGNPRGVAGALTAGIIHAIGPNHAPNQQRWIWADVRLAPGNSGGPLADAAGRVVGINSGIAGGLALAIPSKVVNGFLSGQEQRPYLGVTLQPVLIPVGGRPIFGLLVLEVARESPAELTGLLIGDVLTGAKGQLFRAIEDLEGALHGTTIGGRLQLNLVRGGESVTCNVLLKAGPKTERLV
jgi:serine protease Do